MRRRNRAGGYAASGQMDRAGRQLDRQLNEKDRLVWNGSRVYILSKPSDNARLCP